MEKYIDVNYTPSKGIIRNTLVHSVYDFKYNNVFSNAITSFQMQ